MFFRRWFRWILMDYNLLMDNAMHGNDRVQGAVPPACWNDWRWQWRNRVEGEEGLIRLLTQHDQTFDRTALRRVVARYRFCAVPYVLDRIDWHNENDPVRCQCIPDGRELADDPAGTEDPFEETMRSGVPGLVHRFPDRVLIVVNTVCAMYCRHCTRKNTLEQPSMQSRQPSFSEAVDYIAARPGVREVLLSGGEPLLLETETLDELLGALLAIPHVETVRIGSRAPAVLPMRIDDALVRMLRRHRPLWFNTQFNHPCELTPEARSACERLVDAGIPVSNQTVLLKGINDRLDVMRELCCSLQRCRVRPYYVFLCDPVSGIAHFRVSREEAGALQEALRAGVGGLCLPRFVEDVPSARAKVSI